MKISTDIFTQDSVSNNSLKGFSVNNLIISGRQVQFKDVPLDSLGKGDLDNAFQINDSEFTDYLNNLQETLYKAKEEFTTYRGYFAPCFKLGGSEPEFLIVTKSNYNPYNKNELENNIYFFLNRKTVESVEQISKAFHYSDLPGFHEQSGLYIDSFNWELVEENHAVMRAIESVVNAVSNTEGLSVIHEYPDKLVVDAESWLVRNQTHFRHNTIHRLLMNSVHYMKDLRNIVARCSATVKKNYHYVCPIEFGGLSLYIVTQAAEKETHPNSWLIPASIFDCIKTYKEGDILTEEEQKQVYKTVLIPHEVCERTEWSSNGKTSVITDYEALLALKGALNPKLKGFKNQKDAWKDVTSLTELDNKLIFGFDRFPNAVSNVYDKSLNKLVTEQYTSEDEDYLTLPWDWHGNELICLKPKRKPKTEIGQFGVIVINVTECRKLPTLTQVIESLEQSFKDSEHGEPVYHQQVISKDRIPPHLQLSVGDFVYEHKYILNLETQRIDWEVRLELEMNAVGGKSDFVNSWNIYSKYL